MPNLGALSSSTDVGTSVVFPYVTVLPVSPVDGQMVAYGADPTNGVIWWLRYRSAASGSYKWEYIGGPSIQADGSDVFSAGTASTTYVSIAGSPSITLPLSGDYLIEVGHASWHTVTGVGVICSYAIGATAALDVDAAQSWSGSGSNDTQESYRPRRKTGLTAGSLVDMRWRSSAASTANLRRPWLRITPVRVG